MLLFSLEPKMIPYISHAAHVCLTSADSGSPGNNPGFRDSNTSHLGWELQTGQTPISYAMCNGEIWVL